MMIYKSDIVPETTYEIFQGDKGDRFRMKNMWGTLEFPVPEHETQPTYYRIIDNKVVHREVDNIIKAFEYIKERPIGLPQQDFEAAIASLLGMKYGKYQEKKRKGEIRFEPYEERNNKKAGVSMS